MNDETKGTLLQCINVMRDKFSELCTVRQLPEAQAFYHAYYRAYEELLKKEAGKEGEK